MGRVIVAGAGRMTVPSTGILASDLAVGTVVKLMEGGTAVEYLVVNQGKPSGSSLYDDSCDGTWLLRKYIHSKRVWNSSSTNDYEGSKICNWLDADFYPTFGSAEQTAIKQIKIPYTKKGSIASGANGLSCKAFLLGGLEVGFFNSGGSTRFPADGAKLSYFLSGTDTDADNKRIASLNNEANNWYLRSPQYGTGGYVTSVLWSGSYFQGTPENSDGIRPAVIIDKTSMFDAATMLLKG